MPRPTKLTPLRHARIVELLRDGVPFATACRSVGVSASAGYEWLYRGWGTHPDRPPAPVYVAFAQAVDAVFPDGFAERYADEDEFADAQNNGETTWGEEFSQFSQSVARASAEAEPAKASETQRHARFAEPENRLEAGGDAGANEPIEEFAEPLSDTHKKNARTREEEGAEEPRRAPMPWLSKRSRDQRSILDEIF
jgi:hypothetical protein